MSSESISVPVGLTTEGLLGRRYLARFIDSLLIGFLFGVVAGMMSSMLGMKDSLLVWLTLPVIWIGYGSVLEYSPWQATLGKWVMGLRVYDSTARRLTFPQAVGRNFVKDGPFLAFALIPAGKLLSAVWLVAHLIVLHRSPVYQAIHDRVAKTWVASPEATIRLNLS